jgi:1-acyl-sn-glycerol-3-phosphate acyltransferase
MIVPPLAVMVPQTHNPFSQWLGKVILQLLGWKITGKFPQRAKFLVAIAPHTSNWDFVIAVAAMLAIQIKIRFLGKNTLFFWPFKIWLEHIGGIPVERSSSYGIVEQMVTLFKDKEQLVLAIAPEGTRRKVKEWKSGFLYIAHQAKVPVVPLSLDFAKKEITIHGEIFIQANIAQELIRFKKIFTDISAKKPQNS